MKMKMKLLRVSKGLSQQQAADLMGVNRVTYQSVESGQRAGSHAFWALFQEAFNVPGNEMWGIMHDEAEEPAV